jgi:hypothetical protein
MIRAINGSCILHFLSPPLQPDPAASANCGQGAAGSASDMIQRGIIDKRTDAKARRSPRSITRSPQT